MQKTSDAEDIQTVMHSSSTYAAQAVCGRKEKRNLAIKWYLHFLSYFDRNLEIVS